MVRNTLDALILGIIRSLKLGLFRNELYDLKLFYFLCVIWKDDLYIIP